MEQTLEVKNLHKNFKKLNAVNGISFSIPAGSCFGLLGPNGAGKTTTIEMLEGIQQANSGEILYKGQSLGDRFRAEAGIMFQSTALPEFITVQETLDLFSSLYEKTAAIDTLIDKCALSEFLQQDTQSLSGGQRQRVLLAIALINDPEIIFLDEPTTGLDPQSRRNFWDLINQIKQDNKTILITTHYMEEAHALCDEIAIMDHGKIIARGSPKELLTSHFSDTVLEFHNRDAEAACKSLGLHPIAHGEHFSVTTPDVNHTLEQLMQKGVSLNQMNVRHATLEDLFIELTGKELRS
ncbi:MAG: ABC transporter ATP-binding protein [Gammaproteobacteria bacterium]|nr:ABC transporter ATP-binding protein [Gammaproteobacteria bacterium]MDH5801175.1 ABC transporter ATP-binding protein [Gammaproteobacteria bacterium]